jgi:sulfofructose kinase
VFRVAQMPAPDTKTNASAFMSIGGGNAANAAVAVARLGGRAGFAGPLGEDDVGTQLIRGLEDEGIDCSGCVRSKGVASPLSAIIVDQNGGRTIVTYRDQHLSAVRPRDAAALVADLDGLSVDNRLPEFVQPICEAARARGLPIVLDVDKATTPDHPLLSLATHVIFSGQALLETMQMHELEPALARMAQQTASFVAVTDGANDVLWRAATGIERVPAFAIEAVDTLGAGDVFHGAFAVRLLEDGSIDQALRFAAAAAAVKCLSFGGSTAIPTRAVVDTFLTGRP